MMGGNYSYFERMGCKGSFDDLDCEYESFTTIKGGCTEEKDVTMPLPRDPSTLDDVPLGPVPPPFPSQPDSGGDGSSHEDVIRNELMNHPSAF